MNKQFDVAISFAGSEREYARAIAAIATANGATVFLDELYEAELWGTNLVESLSDVYESRARFCLLIISEEYRKRVYTNVERRAALDRAILSKGEYILPVVVDNSWIDGLPKATAYLDLRKKSVISICEALMKKVRGTVSEKLRIPEDIHLSRLPIGTLKAEELTRYLLDLCTQSKNAGVVVFGCLVYDESTVELRKLLKDEDYWDALDKASGPDLEIFAVKDEVKYGEDARDYFEKLTPASLSRSRSRGYYFSKLLKEYFGKEKTTLTYPSFVLFLVENQKVSHCRLIPLSRDSIQGVFSALQQLFTTIAGAIESWRAQHGTTTSQLWEVMKKCLQKDDYTLYIQRTPSDAADAVRSLARFAE